MRPFARATIIGLALSLFGAASVSFADDTAVKLQGKGSRRESLSAMSYKPFNPALWGNLDGWSGGPALTKESTAGKPVLIVAWAAWYSTSHPALAEAQKLAAKNADLIVIAVHHTKGFDRAAAILADKKISIPFAHDAKGEFFRALRIDAAGPNFYIIDRAGNLRFADVEKPSLEEAVKIVTDETAESASKAKEHFEESQKAKGDTPLAGPDVKTRPELEQYKKAEWPKTSKQVAYAKNVQGKPLPAVLGKETWLTPKPDLNGKVVVLDFWATWCHPCLAASPILDDLQDKNKDTLVVVGMSGQGATESAEAIKAFLKKNKSSYSHANDAAQTVYKSLNISGIPHVVVMSTDGIVRWQGNPHDPEFTTVVDKVIKADPWVQARAKSKKG